jgi:hypothetical protein
VSVNSIPPEIVDKVIATIESEAMELTRKPPETLRSEFGFGRVNGILLAVDRFKTLLDFELEELAKKQESDEDTL